MSINWAMARSFFCTLWMQISSSGSDGASRSGTLPEPHVWLKPGLNIVSVSRVTSNFLQISKHVCPVGTL